jgi:plasmid stabilization system protein ParE
VTGRLIVQPEAEADLVEAFRWYENKRAGLGAEFLEAVSRALERLAQHPLRHAVVHRETRRVLLRRFPYAVLYTVRADHVYVLGILHQRRNPRVAKRRSGGVQE